MEEKSMILKCEAAARQIRKDIIEMTYKTGNIGAHLGGEPFHGGDSFGIICGYDRLFCGGAYVGRKR